MTIKITPVIMIGLALITFASNSRAEIASKAYVDDQDKLLIFGTTTPNNNQIEHAEVGGVWGYVDEAYNLASEAWNIADTVGGKAVATEQPNSGILTSKDGSVKIASGGVINDSLVSSGAAIQLGKLGFPTPGAECTTRGCMLMFYNGQYVWEVVTRDTNETIATTGAVSATPTTGTTVTEVTAASANF